MSRELRRLLISPSRLNPNDILKLNSSETHYLTRVLRYQIGEYFIVVDGVGRLWSATLASLNDAYIKQPLLQGISPVPQINLVIALPRKGFDSVLRITTELGIDRIQPLIAERCMYNQEERLQRWHSILEEATEQCERLWLPLCGHPCDAQRWIQKQRRYATTHVNQTDILKIFATTRQDNLTSIDELLRQVSSYQVLPRQIYFAVGPEGGWTIKEEQIAERSGWYPVTLGPRILQTQTAAIAGTTLIANWRIKRSGF
ncbi:MAG TPA: 16S rRNA (uracil(1498)-N(3))-methyltransferase [Prochlorococcaceae cyanobacterium AMR_MDS_5431]|nr:16S rRNA (uracil(1498)-N(3))-methyltransferase [Prochlorococcaceae cyanobacterium AMR_MDS_5431]